MGKVLVKIDYIVKEQLWATRCVLGLTSMAEVVDAALQGYIARLDLDIQRRIQELVYINAEKISAQERQG